MRFPCSLLFSRPNLLSLSSQGSVPLLLPISRPFSGFVQTVPSLSYSKKDPRTGCSVPAGSPTGAEQRSRILSIALLPRLLLMQPRILLPFWSQSAHGWVMSSFSSAIILKSFSAGLFSIASSNLQVCQVLPPWYSADLPVYTHLQWQRQVVQLYFVVLLHKITTPHNPLIHMPGTRHPTGSCNTLELLLLVASVCVECRFLTMFCREAAPQGISHDAKLHLVVSDQVFHCCCVMKVPPSLPQFLEVLLLSFLSFFFFEGHFKQMASWFLSLSYSGQ